MATPPSVPVGKVDVTQQPLAKPKAMIDLMAWDAEMTSVGKSGGASNYEKLYEQMAQASKESPENLEILSRLAQATYFMGLNLTEPAQIKAKTAEALTIAEKVVAIDANNFRGHIWQAMTSGKLALLGCPIQEKIKYSVTFLRSLAVCIRLNPSEPMVLFMESRFQLALSCSLSEEEKAAIKTYINFPDVNWEEAEAKLRQSLAVNAAFLDGYVTLANLLIKAKKYAEAKEVILKGLSQQLVTKSDEQMATEMKALQNRINSIVPQ